MTKTNQRTLKKFDRYVAEMRAAGCVVIAYSPDDVRNAIRYQFADSMSDHKFEFHPDVNLVEVAQDTHEDDALWDAISEAVAHTYRISCETWDEYNDQEEVL